VRPGNLLVTKIPSTCPGQSASNGTAGAVEGDISSITHRDGAGDLTLTRARTQQLKSAISNGEEDGWESRAGGSERTTAGARKQQRGARGQAYHRTTAGRPAW